jgi:leucine dehydrogenase
VPGVFETIGDEPFEQIVHCHDPQSGLRAIIALHSTVLGPGLGGTRFYDYPSEGDAVRDVCRLARAMTYKHAAAGLDQGGGKAVILGDPRAIRTDELIRAYGRAIHRLGGRYYTAEDVGTTQADMDLIRTITPYVTGVSESLGGSGDPSPATAWGLLWAMKAVAGRLWGDEGLAGRHVSIAGVGKVGAALAGHLAEEGVRLTVADVNDAATAAMVQAHGAEVVAPHRAHAVECDLFAPCALGGALNARTIPELRCAAIVGSANNQLETAADGRRLADRGVLYAPDYIVNAGGVINIAEEPKGYDRALAYERIKGVHDTVLRVLALADERGITPAEAADRLAEQRIEDATHDADRPPHPQRGR